MIATAVNEFLDDLRGGRMTEAPVVTVEHGRLQGRVANTPNGKAFYSFQGIPYAKPPLGSLRFKAPQPVEPWDDIRDATTEGNACPQIDAIFTKQFLGDENCLYLNVYTPNLDGEFLPVMVFLHGGAFKCGSATSTIYGGDFLVEKDVVVVTINYRLGALGFLSLNTPEVPGNAGLKDMLQALRWVKDNIHNFGGNSGNITLFGESAGGIATSVFTASPASKDLINKVIIQSGTAMWEQSFQRNPVENARRLAHALGSEAEDVDEILDFLSATSTRELVEVADKLPTGVLDMVFGIVIEQEFPGVEAILTEPFYDILVSGRIANIPVMIGSTTLEFTFDRESDDLQDLIPKELHIERNSQAAVDIANKMKALYFKGSHTGVESLKEYFELLSDVTINVQTHRHIKNLVQVSNKPIYFYKFDYVGELNITKKVLSVLGLEHAGHSDDLGYLFNNELMSDTVPTSQDIKMRERMVRLWTNFAKSGNPTPDENHYLNVTWVPVTHDNLYYLNLGSELSLGSNPDKEKMDFWDEIYSKHFIIWQQPKETRSHDFKTSEPVISDDAEVAPTAVVFVDSPVAVGETLEETAANSEETVKLVDTESEPVNLVDTEPVKSVDTEPVNLVDTEPEPVNIVDTEPVTLVDTQPEPAKVDTEPVNLERAAPVNFVNGNGDIKKARTSNEIKMVQNGNGVPKDVIRANDPPEDDLPKNIGVNKFVNFFESLGGKK